MTDDERHLGESAVKKAKVQQALEECREDLKAAAKKVDLPVSIHLEDGTCVQVLPPPYPTGMPQVKRYRVAS